jgi:hypothetical protein
MGGKCFLFEGSGVKEHHLNAWAIDPKTCLDEIVAVNMEVSSLLAASGQVHRWDSARHAYLVACVREFVFR